MRVSESEKVREREIGCVRERDRKEERKKTIEMKGEERKEEVRIDHEAVSDVSGIINGETDRHDEIDDL